MSIFVRLQLLRLFIGLVRNPQRTELIFQVVKIGTKHKDNPVAQAVMERVSSHPDFRALYDERYLPPWPTLEELRASPAGSFGEALYHHLNDNGLDLDLFPRLQKIEDSLDYLNARAYQDHDLWHALLGYTTKLEDELALQAFSVAQFGAPLGSLIIAGGILHLMINDPLQAPAAVAKIAEGYRLGQQCRFLLGMKLVDLLPRPLEEVRARAGATSRPVATENASAPSPRCSA